MSKKVKVIIKRAILLDGKHVEPSDKPVEINDKLARELVGINKAELFKPKSEVKKQDDK